MLTWYIDQIKKWNSQSHVYIDDIYIHLYVTYVTKIYTSVCCICYIDKYIYVLWNTILLNNYWIVYYWILLNIIKYILNNSISIKFDIYLNLNISLVYIVPISKE